MRQRRRRFVAHEDSSRQLDIDLVHSQEDYAPGYGTRQGCLEDPCKLGRRPETAPPSNLPVIFTLAL